MILFVGNVLNRFQVLTCSNAGRENKYISNNRPKVIAILKNTVENKLKNSIIMCHSSFVLNIILN